MKPTDAITFTGSRCTTKTITSTRCIIAYDLKKANYVGILSTFQTRGDKRAPMVNLASKTSQRRLPPDLAKLSDSIIGPTTTSSGPAHLSAVSVCLCLCLCLLRADSVSGRSYIDMRMCRVHRSKQDTVQLGANGRGRNARGTSRP